MQRPPVIDYKLVDVPELGYFATDRPHPRGELLVKTAEHVPRLLQAARGHRRACSTPTATTAPATSSPRSVPTSWCTSTAATTCSSSRRASSSPLAKLEAVFGNSPLVRQIYVYGNSAQPYLLAVVVPTEDALATATSADALKPLIAESLQNVAKAGRPAVLRDPARLHHRDHAVHPGERSADRHPQAGVAEAEGALRRAPGAALRRAGRRPGQRAARTASQRRRRAGAGDRQPGRRRDCSAQRESELTARRALHRPGWRLVVGVDIRQPAARDLRRRRAGGRDRQPGQRPAGHRRLHRGRATAAPSGRRSPRCTAATRPRCTPPT